MRNLALFTVFLTGLLKLSHQLDDDPPVQFPVRVGAFNIQNLGNSKFSNEFNMNIIKKIILRFDVIFIQEIVTKDESLMEGLVANLNEMAPKGTAYKMTISERLGRGTAKEQYAYIYNENKLEVIAAEVFPDVDDLFMRPPYIVKFSVPTTRDLSTFLAIGVHTQPKFAVNETHALARVYDYASERYDVKEAIMMGDMNAGCNAIRVNDWANIETWTRKDFTWLIGHDVDTTTYLTGCPYDRFITAGERMKLAVIPSTVTTFNFREEYELTDEQTRGISDHWPIELQLRGKLSNPAEKNLKSQVCFKVADKRKITIPENLLKLKQSMGFRIIVSEGDSGTVVATKTSANLDTILSNLQSFQAKYPDMLTYEASEATRYKAMYGGLDDGSSYVEKPKPFYTASIECGIVEQKCNTLFCADTNIN